MIGYLSGEVFEIFQNNIIILINGVGYKVFPTSKLLLKRKKGDKVELYISSIIKEDAFDLYGFETIEEKKLFELIIGISGIGPRTGIAVLSKFGIEDIMNAISDGDAAFFTGIPRLGKKNAQKLIIELRNKTGDIGSLDLTESKERKELLQALKSFGYEEKEVMPIMKDIEKNGGKIEQQVVFALKQLGKK